MFSAVLPQSIPSVQKTAIFIHLGCEAQKKFKLSGDQNIKFLVSTIMSNLLNWR